MKRRQTERLAALTLLLATMTLPGQQVRWPDAEETEKITAAIPTKPTASPAQARKLLVVGSSSSHPSAPIAAKTFQLMGERSGAFQVDFADDSSIFEAEKLQQFDAVVANNWNGYDPFLPVTAAEYQGLSDDWKVAMRRREEMLRQNFLKFIADGKGFVAIHAALMGPPDWKEYPQVIGAKHAATPWSEAILQVEDPRQALGAGFPGRFFSVRDEVYELQAPYSRQNLRILLSVDPFQTTAPKSSQEGKPVRTDSDFGVSWVKRYGQGRVFYCALGHARETYWNPVIVRHFLDGIQFALGDLTGDTTPTAQARQVDGPRRGLIQQAGNGAVRLLARDVTIHGRAVRFEPAPKSSVGFWSDPEDWLSWGFKLKQPGVFKVELTQACGRGNQGSEYTVTVGDQVLRDTVRNTGSFTNFLPRTVGEVKLSTPGDYRLAIQPTKKTGFVVMELRSVVLTPVTP